MISFGQNSNDKVIYRDSLLNLTDTTNYKHKYVVKNYFEEKEKYEIEKFIKDNNQDVLEAIYQVNDKNNFVLNGYCKIIKNNKTKSICNYVNNKMVGDYSEYYDNQKLKLEGEYVNVNKNDVLIIKNYWNENGQQTVKNYNGTYEFLFNGKIPIKGEIKNGFMEGNWTSTNYDFPKYEYKFSNNVLIEGTIYKSEKKKRKIKKDEPALPKNGLTDFSENLRFEIERILKKSRLGAGTYRLTIK